MTGFIPRIRCDQADANASITLCPTDEGSQVYYNFSTVSSQGCRLRSSSDFTVYTLPPPPLNATSARITVAYASDIHSNNCNGSAGYNHVESQYRFLSIADLGYQFIPQSPSPNVRSGCDVSYWHISMPRQAAILCNVSYSMEAVDVTMDKSQLNTTQGLNVSTPLTASGRTLENFGAVDFIRDVDRGII